MSNDYLGRGWSFPPEFNAASLSVEMLEYEDDVASSLHVLLTTMRGERIMLPSYGCGLEELLFESLDTRTKTLVKDKIAAAILYHEPRIKVEKVELNDTPFSYDANTKSDRIDTKEVQQLDGIIWIVITYTIKQTNSRFNFVFPYYIKEGTDVNLTSSVRLLSDS